MKRLTCPLVVLWCATALFAADNPADSLARTVLAKAGVHATVCEIPRVGDGTLTAALAKAGIPHVHALAPDAQVADTARKSSVAAGVMGSQLIIETGKPDALPLGDWVADLYVVADATDANLKTLSAAEAGRILSPYRGVAVVGNPAGAKGELSRTVLENWAKGCGGTTTISEDASGLWAVVKMPPLKGGDDWGHFYHGPDGNPVSKDTAFSTAPFELQWFGKPSVKNAPDITLASAGRLFILSCSRSGVWDWPDYAGGSEELRVCSLYSGEVLWRRPLEKNFGRIGSLAVATRDRFFLKNENRVLILDPETGAEMGRIAVSEEKRDCIWLALSDGVLVTLAGPKRDYAAELKEIGRLGQSKEEIIVQNPEDRYYGGQELSAWDPANGKQLWSFREERIDPAHLVLSDGKVYLYAKGTYTACLDLKTGGTLWKTNAPTLDPVFNWGKGGFPNIFGFHQWMSRQGGIATKDAYLISYRPHWQFQAFSATDGKLLWERTQPGKGEYENIWKKNDARGGQSLVLGSTIMDKGGKGVDLLTGKPVDTGLKCGLGGCGPFTATENGLLLSLTGQILDRQRNEYLVEPFVKSSCHISSFVADGLHISTPGRCVCMEWRGMILTRSAPQRSASVGPRLEKGTAIAPAQSVCDAMDWPTYRANAARSASSEASVSPNGVIRWTFTPTGSPNHAGSDYGKYPWYWGPDINATPPIAVRENIWFGTADGAVVCLDRKMGTEVWRYWTAGRIVSSPTWSDGCLFAGSCDGWVYCLDAATGHLVWRYRVAPDERRIMVQGYLSSAWPVMAGVLVHNGTAYAAAGLIGQLGGSVLCAVNARTGAIVWEKRFADPKEWGTSTARLLPPPAAAGQLALSEGRLWWHAGQWGLIALDATTGSARPAVDLAPLNYDTNSEKHVLNGLFRGNRGQDVGVLPGGWVVFGGRQFFSPLEDVGFRGDGCSFLQTDRQGQPKLAILKLVKPYANNSIPAWDSNQVLLNSSEGKSAVLQSGLCEALDADAAAHPLDTAPVVKRNYTNSPLRISPALPAEQQRPVLPDGLSKLKDFRILTPILAGNAVVFLGGKQRETDGHVYAVSRVERKLLWDVNLPAMPLLGGLSFDRAGDVLVPLVDGCVVCIGTKE